MPYIKVNVDKIKEYQQDVYNIRRRVSTISSNFSSISSRLDSDVKNSSGIRRKLNNIDETLSEHKTVLQRMNVFLENTSRQYINAEKMLFIKDPLSGDAGDVTFGNAFVDFFKDGLSYENESSDSNYKYSGTLEIDGFEYDNKKGLNDIIETKINRPQQKEYKSKHNINSEDKFYKKTGTVLEGKVDNKKEVSVINLDAEGECDWAQGKAEMKVLTAEVHAAAAAGFYVYEKDKNGKTVRVFSPGVSAEVGASASIFEASAEGRIGLGEDNNMLGVYGQVNAEIGSAEAAAKVSLSSGNIYAGASAEANLVKVEGSAGISVLGTDVGVHGALKVGVGAHIDVGFTDGKLKFDIGAALGVGFDLGFEIDMKGTVDALVGVCEPVIDFMADVGKSISKGIKNIFKGW